MNALGWAQAWAIARRDLHRQFRGLRLLLVCLFLGVGALAAIGSLTSAIRSELQAQGQILLGGDIEAEVYQRPLTEDEYAFLSEYGELSQGVRMRAMVRSGDDEVAPVALKSVEPNWPLYGALTLMDGRSVGAPPDNEAWIAQGLADRLSLDVGDNFTLGNSTLTVGGIIGEEPDRLSEGFTLGQTVIVPYDVPELAGLTQPGALYETKTRLRFDGSPDPESVEEAINEAFPESGLDIRTRDRASPGAARFVSRMGEFLTLVGLAALVIAGIGIGGGVSSYLDARRTNIATLKILGATSRDIARIYALQIGAAAILGSVTGLLAGILVTPLLATALGSLLPVDNALVLNPEALFRAAAFGLLVALIFAAPPIMRAREFPAMALMRSRVSPIAQGWRSAALPVAIGLAGIAFLALLSSPTPGLSALFMGGALVMLGLLALLGRAIRWAARKWPRPSNPIIRAALANLYRPGSAIGSLVTALGFGLASFVLLASVQTSLNGNIEQSVPAIAPDYVVLNLPIDRVGEFTAIVEEAAPGSQINSSATLRGTVIAYGPEESPNVVAEMEELPEGAWGLRGERGMTYSETVPQGNVVTQGEWWAQDYAGEPLVSIDEELAQAAGLQIGDIVTVSILGVRKTAHIANFRRLDWESLGFNFVFVFSPNTLADAPHSVAATVAFPDETTPGTLLRDLARAFPSSSVIEVGPNLEEARAILDQVALAILSAASVAVLAGIAVLLGAIAAARSARIYDTVILRVLGASRSQLLGLQLAEFGLLAALLAGVALGLGTAIAWLIITQLFEFDWLPDWTEILAVLGAGIALVLVFAFTASLPVLRAKPAQTLRSL